MATRRSEWLASIKPILDRDEAKKDAAALAKELGDILEVKVGASPENLDELAKEFNAQLKTMGKQPIVFSEKTIKGIVSQFSMAITAGMKDGIDKSKLMLKDLASLQEAYVRHQNASWKKTGKRVRSGFVNSAKGAFEYEPSDTAIKIGNNLRAITNEFNQATNWEEQYVALLKYIKAYEKLESITSDPKSLEKWAMIGDYAIQDLKDARPGIEHSLQNIFQVAYGKAVDGLTDVGDIDVDVKLTPIKMIDAYDITGGKGHIEVEVKPVVKKAKKNETPNAFRGVHKPSGGEGRSISRSLLGGDFWTDNDGKSLFLSSYGEESGEADAKNLTAVFKSLNRLVVDAEEGGRGDAKAFNEIDQLKFLQHLFPGIENFINTADPDSRDYVQKYYNEMARQAGFDLFEVTNVNEGADELATTLVPLQDRIIEWASKIPEYYDVEKFTPEMERDIISRQKGSSERWYAQTIERLESQMAQAVTNEDINEVNYLQGLIPKIKEMYSSAMSNFDTAIAQYGGYIEESVLQGLPEVISANADGKLVPKFSADDLKTKIQEFVRLSKELDQIRDSEPNKKDYASTEEYNEAKDLYDNLEDTYQQKIDILYNQLINGLPNNLQNEIDNLLIDAVDGAASFDDVFNKLQPHLSYNENAVNGAPSTVKHQTKTDKQDGTEKADETKIARTKELVAQMDALNNSEDESVESVRQKLAKLESILSLIKSEGLMTDEILQKSSLIERSLDDRYRKLQSVELEAENTNPISHQNEHEHKSSDITEKYEKASESVKNLVNSLITLDQQMQTLDERTAATNMDGFDKWNPSDEHKNTIVNTLNEYQRVMQQISGFSIETDDDKKKLIELKEEALQLANTLKMAYRSDSNPDSYMKDYRVSRDQAGVFMDINNESSKLRNEIRTALNSEFSSVFQQIQDEDSGFARALLDDANGLSGLADKIMADTNAHKQNTAAIEEEARAQEQLKNTQVQTTDTDYDAETIAKENGALEDKLELLQEIAEQYGNNISQKQRDRYEELNQKDMNEGLTPKEDERYWELGEQIEEADSALEEFGQTYDKIIVKLENGKKVEILPDDKGLRTLAKIDEEYGESYNGVEIEDVVFERVKQEAVATEQAVDGLNESLEKTQQLTSGDGTGSGTGDASSSELEAERAKAESLQNEIDQKNSALQAANEEKQALQNDLDETKQQLEDSEHEKSLYDSAMNQLTEESNEKDGIIYDLREQIANDGDALFTAEQRANEAEERANQLERKLAETFDGDKKQTSVNTEELKTLLNSIVYNVKITHDDNDKTANKIALDDSTLETTLTKVFANILNPQAQQNDSGQVEKHWALETTLQTVKGVLDNIHTNTTKIGVTNAPGVDVISDTVLDGRLAEIKSVLESIDNKIAKGGVIATRGAVKQANSQPVEPEAKTQAARSNMMKSLINDYKTMGKLAAQFASDGNLETKAMLENLKEEIARKRQSLKLTMDENASLREKYSIAFDAEKRLLDAEKAQKEINAQVKADAKETEAAWKKQVKDAQRATGVNAATSTANAGDQTVLRAIGTEGVSKDIENKAKELSDNIKTLRALRDEIDKKGEQASDADRDRLSKQITKVKELKTEVDGYLKIHEKYSGDNVTDLGDASNFGAVGTDQYWNNITAAIKNASSGKTTIKGLNADTGELTGTTKIAANTFAEWSATVDPITGRLSMLRTGIKKTETILESITRKTKEIFTYFSGSSIIFKAFNELKKGIQYVKEIDLALTELKKVTDETEETYDRFLETAAKTGARLGTTISAVTEATATFAKLGYTMEQSTEMAEAAIVYKNVGDNIASTGDAADSIISTLKGFGLEASESMAIVDKFNEVGNRFAITSQGIGEALRLSASALNEGGNSLDEAIGMITAANEVVNDPSSVGTALKTLTLRLRGSKTELEEMGEDVSDMATTTSQLQAKLLALTGGKVDIMLDENTFKNSTQILREMADAWEDMSDIQRASALELMGGKRQANMLSALIQNFETAEKVIEAAANSAGSALEENERYLDSIQGKVDQLTNSLQSLWMNTLDSDLIKSVVDLGIEIINVVDNIGLLTSALLALVAYKGIAALFKTFKASAIPIKTIWQYINELTIGFKGFTMAQMKANAATAAGHIVNSQYSNSLIRTNLIQWLTKKSTDALEAAKYRLWLAEKGLEVGIATETDVQAAQAAVQAASIPGDYAKMTTTELLGLGFKKLAISVWEATKAVAKFLFTNPVGWFILAIGAVAGGIAVFNHFRKTTEELAEAVKEVLSEYQNATKTLKEHYDIIQDVRKDYEELADGVDSLGKNISLTSEEYERYNEITNQIADMFPQMVSGYTAEGNAIIALKGNVEELTKAYEEEARAANQAILAGSNDVFKNFKNNVDKDSTVSWDQTGLTQQYKLAEEIIKLMQEGNEDSINKMWSDLNATNYTIDGQVYSNIEKSALFKAAGINESEFLSAWDHTVDIEEFKKQEAKLLAYFNTLTSKINAEVANVRPIVSAYLANDLEYAKLTNDAQSTVQKIVNYLDAEFYLQFDNATDLQAYVTKNIVKPLQDIDTSTDFKTAFDLQTKFNKGEVSIEEYEQMVEGIISLIEGLGLDGADNIIKSIKLVFDVDDSGLVNENIQEVTKKLLDPSEHDKIKTLTKSDLDVIDQNASTWSQNAKWNGTNWEINEPILMSWDQLIEKIKEAKSTVEGLKTSESIEPLSKIKEKLSGLGEAFDQFTEDGKISIDTLLDLNEKFGTIDGFEDFINVLGNSASTTKQVETAISDMASAYLATTDILSDITDENYTFIVSQLKALGVTNPEEYLQNLQSIHNAMAEEYGVDLSNYGTVEQMKQAISSDLYGILVGLEGMTIKELASKYGDDLLNYSNLEEAKTEAARREALKRQEILKGEQMADAKQNAEGWKNSQTVKKDEIETGWWIFGKNKYEGKTYSEMEALASSGDAKAKEWVDNIQSTYNSMVAESTESAESAYAEAVNNINEATKQFNSIDDYVAQYNLKLKVDVPSLGDDEGDSKKLKDAFQAEMDYWENRLSANQAKADRLQGQIDLLEQKGMKASAQYYKDQMALLASEDANDGIDSKMELLKGQLDAVTTRLGQVKEGSEEWWEAAHEYNDIVNEIQEIESAIVDMQDAIGEIETYKFEEFNNRLDNLISKLETIRNLIAPDGEEDWFDDEGNWTEEGIGVLGTYVNDLEFFKQGLQESKDALTEFNKIGNGAEWSKLSEKQQKEYANKFGIQSEQDYYEKTEELISQQYDYMESISDTEQSIVDMYESSIDAIEEYFDTLIDGYNDYIDSVKEALDAERDLYDFKKNVQKQAKDISELERRIASLSGSTNKADIAERRKLEAQLYESRESLNDTYYDHAKDAQQDALDQEAEAYEETMTKMVEGMRTSLQEATANMETFLDSVTIAVSMNADIVLEKYRETEVPLNDSLTNPWEEAAEKAKQYGKDANNLMDVWKADGYFAEFKSTASTNLSSPWSDGTSAASAFGEGVKDVMKGVVDNVATNVSNIRSQLATINQEIRDTEARAASANVDVPSVNTTPSGVVGSPKISTPTQERTPDSTSEISRIYGLSNSQILDLGYGPISLAKFEQLLKDYQIKFSAIYKQVANTRPDERLRRKVLYGEYVSGPLAVRKHAKGTAGTKRDEWAITDEPQFGDELVLVPGKDGNLSFMRKGTGVVPADLTANLMEWGQFTPDSMNLGSGVNINMINNAVNKPEFNFAFDALVKAENITEETLPAVKKLVTQELNRFTKELNYALKGKGAR